jgi:hypothetical protein
MTNIRRILLTLLLCLPTLAIAAPAQAAYSLWYIPPNKTSPLLRTQGCTFRVLWGNYGSAPFAKFIDYSTPKCSGLAVTVIWQVGSETFESAEVTSYWTSGSDSCGGSYKEKQATGRAPGIATGMSLRFSNDYLAIISSRTDWSSISGITIKKC